MHLTNFILVFFACGSSVWFVSMFIAFRRSRMSPEVLVLRTPPRWLRGKTTVATT